MPLDGGAERSDAGGDNPPDPDLRPFLEEGIAAFNAGRFFSCHEILEEAWLSTHGPARLFLQGLIQIAAGFHHIVNANRLGARSQLDRGLEKLSRYPDRYEGVAVGELCNEVTIWLAKLESEAWSRPETAAVAPRIRLAPADPNRPQSR